MTMVFWVVVVVLVRWWGWPTMMMMVLDVVVVVVVHWWGWPVLLMDDEDTTAFVMPEDGESVEVVVVGESVEVVVVVNNDDEALVVVVVVVVVADMASKSVAHRTRFKELPEATHFILPNDMVRRILVSKDPGDGNDDDNNDVDEVVKTRLP